MPQSLFHLLHTLLHHLWPFFHLTMCFFQTLCILQEALCVLQEAPVEIKESSKWILKIVWGAGKCHEEPVGPPTAIHPPDQPFHTCTTSLSWIYFFLQKKTQKPIFRKNQEIKGITPPKLTCSVPNTSPSLSASLVAPSHLPAQESAKIFKGRSSYRSSCRISCSSGSP